MNIIEKNTSGHVETRTSVAGISSQQNMLCSGPS